MELERQNHKWWPSCYPRGTERTPWSAECLTPSPCSMDVCLETVTLYLLRAPLILGGLACYFIKGPNREIRKKRRVWKGEKKGWWWGQGGSCIKFELTWTVWRHPRSENGKKGQSKRHYEIWQDIMLIVSADWKSAEGREVCSKFMHSRAIGFLNLAAHGIPWGALKNTVIYSLSERFRFHRSRVRLKHLDFFLNILLIYLIER